MPSVDRPIVPGGAVRHGRRHTWPGGHDMSQLVKAAKLEVEATPQGEGTRVRTWVTNVGAGHNIPTDVVIRRYWTGLSNMLRLYLPLADVAAIYDNSDRERALIAEKVPEGSIVVFDPLRWAMVEWRSP